MKRVDIKTGFVCNNNCIFCVQAHNKLKGNRSIDEIKENLSECRQRCEIVVLTGGEVSIRDDFFEIIAYAKELGYSLIQIQSNGRMFSSLDVCKKAINAGANEFAFALHGFNAEQHDSLTRSKGSFLQTVSAIKNLRKLGCKVIMNTVVVKQNYKDLEKIAKLLVNLDVNQFQMAFVHPMGNAWQNFEDVVPRISEAAPFIHKALRIGINSGKVVMAEAMPYCMMHGYEKCIAEEITPDTEIRGKEYQNTNDFTRQRKELGKVKFEKCKKCKNDGVCEGPWKEYAEKYGDEEFEAICL